MGVNSAIEWTNHTFNPWWGCTRVSPACKHCYAEKWAKRVGHDVWGSRAPRRWLSDNYWDQPRKWAAAAAFAGARPRVFCASMADAFEPRHELDRERGRLWRLIERTPELDWLLLIKRPQHISSMMPWSRRWPANVWVGTTVENLRYADERLPYLMELPAVIRFISAEPLLARKTLKSGLERSTR